MQQLFEKFYAQPKLQAITISLCLGLLFFLVPILQRKARVRLSLRQKELYDPIASDILVQVFVLFGGIVVYSLVALVRSDIQFVSGDALPFVCVLGSASGLWNIRRAATALRSAQAGSNARRLGRMAEVYSWSLTAYTAGLISLIYGLVVVFFVLLAPAQLPSWLWFLSFLMTGPTLFALGWSISVLAVATEYVRNVRLGRSNPSFKRTA